MSNSSAKMWISYKIIKNCHTCAEFVMIDRKSLEYGAVYTVGCECCRRWVYLYSGCHELNKTYTHWDKENGMLEIKFTRKS